MTMIINPFAFAAPAGGGAGPASLSGLILRLKASDITGVVDTGSVATWPETSGNNRVVTGASLTTGLPAFRTGIGPNGKPTVHFNPPTGAHGYFNLPNFVAGLTAGHGFAVMKIDNVNVDSAPPFGDFGTAGDGYYGFSSDGYVYEDFGNSTRPRTSLATGINLWHVYEVRSGGGTFANFINGTQLFGSTVSTVFRGAASGPIFIGRTTVNGKFLKGQMAECFMYDRILDNVTERKAVIHAYLNTEYGFSLATS